MTVCIAAIGSDGIDKEAIVYATDNMVSTALLGQFEHSITKYRVLPNNSVAMLAGNPLIFNELTDSVAAGFDFEKTKNQILQNFKGVRKQAIQYGVLDKFGLKDDFIAGSLNNPQPNMFLNTIFQTVAEFNLGTGILLIGFHRDGQADIAEINETGYAGYRSMGFHVIGSGNIQAANTLLFQKQGVHESLITTAYNVYKAKRQAEVAVGVGRTCELFILRKDKGSAKVDEGVIKKLAEIYEQESVFGKTHKKLQGLKI